MGKNHVVVIMRGGCVEKIISTDPDMKLTLVDWDEINPLIEKKQDVNIMPGNYAASFEPNIDEIIKITNRFIECMIHPELSQAEKEKKV